MVKKAIRLPSSKKVYGHDNGDFDEGTLVNLLEQAWELKLKDNDRIITICEYLPDNVKPEAYNLKLKKEIIAYKYLKETYKNWSGKDYSPEEEKERSDFQFVLLEKKGERRSAWGYYSQEINYVRAIEKQQKRSEKERKTYYEEGEKGVKKLKEKWEKEDSSGPLLQIG